MSRIAALGDWQRIRGFAIAGVEAHEAATDEETVVAWQALPADVAILILTPRAQAALKERLRERPAVLVAVLP
jgi:vacuolar-type H+-ATPase subunit F/Vma7